MCIWSVIVLTVPIAAKEEHPIAATWLAMSPAIYGGHNMSYYVQGFLQPPGIANASATSAEHGCCTWHQPCLFAITAAT